LEDELFKSGIRPAINLNLSVSRVGSAAQGKLMKKISGELKFFLAKYNENKVFSSFSSDLDPTTLLVLNRGAKLVELLKQKNYNPLSVEEQFILIYSGFIGLFDNVDINKIAGLEEFILAEFKNYEFFDEDDQIDVILQDIKESVEEIIKNYQE